MQPWRISVGLSAALVGSGVLLAGSRLEYLAPFWPVILADYDLAIAFHLALGLAAVAAALCAVARAAGSISSSAPSGEARGIRSSPVRSRATPRATGTEHRHLWGLDASREDSLPMWTVSAALLPVRTDVARGPPHAAPLGRDSKSIRVS